jgi:hypothetical protein
MEKLIIKLPKTKYRLSSEDCKVIWKDNSEYGYVCSMILPSCNYKVFNRLFFKTVEYIKEVAPFATICLNLQGEGYDIEGITKKFDSLGFSYRIAQIKYDTSNGCPFNRIVDDTCLIAPQNTLMFMRADDDFVFHQKTFLNKLTAGQYYLSAIHYMLTHPNCGTIASNKTNFVEQKKGLIGPIAEEYDFNEVKPKKPYEHRDMNQLKDFVWTCRGIFLRNLKESNNGFELRGRTLPLEVVEQDWTHDGEDVLSPGVRLANGYYIARAKFGLVEHLCNYSSKKGDNGDPRKWAHIWEESKYGQWVRTNLNTDYDRILYSNFFVEPRIFKENYKGEDLSIKKNCRELTVNYNEIPTEKLIEEIKSLL